MVNPLESYIFVGSVTEARLHHISNQLGFKIGWLPFSYLRVPIFKGKPKSRHLRPLLDKIISKLSKWNDSLLIFAGRIQMVKLFDSFMPVHSFTIYSWPKSLIKELEINIKNFIWSVDLSKSNILNVAWSKENINTHTMVSDFLHDGSCNFPYNITNMIPNLCLFAYRAVVPLDNISGSKFWIHTTSGDLTLKGAYNSKSDSFYSLSLGLSIFGFMISPLLKLS
ncbi:unnamed protein product [Lathyrus oleraceus]